MWLKLSPIMMGWIKVVIPSTASTLKMFEPIKLPIEILFWPFKAAIREVTISGREVPNATIVIPITNSDTPTDFAINIALSTNNSEP